jgi:hypothetical protein
MVGLGTIIVVVVLFLVILDLGFGGFIATVAGGGRKAWDNWGEDFWNEIRSSRMLLPLAIENNVQ